MQRYAVIHERNSSSVKEHGRKEKRSDFSLKREVASYQHCLFARPNVLVQYTSTTYSIPDPEGRVTLRWEMAESFLNHRSVCVCEEGGGGEDLSVRYLYYGYCPCPLQNLCTFSIT